jgi:hypothetical protein
MRRRRRRRRPRITCTRESCYANTRQHSAALTGWRAENESSILAADRTRGAARPYRSRRDPTCHGKRSCRSQGRYSWPSRF